MNSKKRALTNPGSFMKSKNRTSTNRGFVYEQQEEGFDQSGVRL